MLLKMSFAYWDKFASICLVVISHDLDANEKKNDHHCVQMMDDPFSARIDANCGTNYSESENRLVRSFQGSLFESLICKVSSIFVRT